MVVAVKQEHVFSTSWMYDEEVYHFIFIGDVIPSEAEVKAVMEYCDDDNGQDGSTYANVIGYAVVEDGQFKKDEYVGSKYATVIDIANKRVGCIKQVWHPKRQPIAEQEIEWMESANSNGAQFWKEVVG